MEVLAPGLAWFVACLVVDADRHPAVVTGLGVGTALVWMVTTYVACWGP